MKTAIWWIRRDLRLSDNQALLQALEHAEQVLPVFVLDPAIVNAPRTGKNRLGFLKASLLSLDDDLRKLGARLILRSGNPVDVFSELRREYGAEMVFAEDSFSTLSRSRDLRVSEVIPLTLTPGLTIYPPGSILKNDGSPYTIFTPFSKAWAMQARIGPPLASPRVIRMPKDVSGESIPFESGARFEEYFPPGESIARQRLDQFIQSGLQAYSENRNRLDLDGTSSLSPYLRFGQVSIRQMVYTVQQLLLGTSKPGSSKGAEAWLNELIWREFYISILYHFPAVRRYSFRKEMDSVSWINDEAGFQAWKDGLTGYPVVDAAMRQLSHTGWMHNRARMIVASFLVKDLLIDWRWGERWFMDQLLDGDTAANNGGWQWIAGTGTDAAPYFRIFNPVLQGKKFDPHGAFIRKYLPEMVNVPDEFVHEPWKMSDGDQMYYGCILGKDYPHPIVDHSFARQRALAAFRNVKSTTA